MEDCSFFGCPEVQPDATWRGTVVPGALAELARLARNGPVDWEQGQEHLRDWEISFPPVTHPTFRAQATQLSELLRLAKWASANPDAKREDVLPLGQNGALPWDPWDAYLLFTRGPEHELERVGSSRRALRILFTVGNFAAESAVVTAEAVHGGCGSCYRALDNWWLVSTDGEDGFFTATRETWNMVKGEEQLGDDLGFDIRCRLTFDRDHGADLTSARQGPLEGRSATAAFYMVFREAVRAALRNPSKPSLMLSPSVAVTASPSRHADGRLILGAVRGVGNKVQGAIEVGLDLVVVAPGNFREACEACESRRREPERVVRTVVEQAETVNEALDCAARTPELLCKYLDDVIDEASRTPWSRTAGAAWRLLRLEDMAVTPHVRKLKRDAAAMAGDEQSRTEVTVSWEDELSGRLDGRLAPRCAITGEAGSGKSFLAQWTVARLARKALNGIRQGDAVGQDPVPIFLRPQAIGTEPAVTGESPFTQLARLAVVGLVREGDDRLEACLAALLERAGEKTVLVIDGLDGNGTWAEAVRSAAVDFVRRQPQAKVIVTSRSVSDVRALEPDPDHACRMAAIGEDGGPSLNEVADAWFGPDLRARADEFREAFRQRPHLQDVCNNPLMASCALAAFESGRFPQALTRAGLLGAVIDEWLERRGDVAPGMEPGEFDAHLGRAACELLCGDPGSSVFSYSRLSRALGTSGLPESAIAGLARAGILQRQGRSDYAFPHRMWLDFLAARHVVQSPDELTRWRQKLRSGPIPAGYEEFAFYLPETCAQADRVGVLMDLLAHATDVLDRSDLHFAQLDLVVRVLADTGDTPRGLHEPLERVVELLTVEMGSSPQPFRQLGALAAFCTAPHLFAPNHPLLIKVARFLPLDWFAKTASGVVEYRTQEHLAQRAWDCLEGVVAATPDTAAGDALGEALERCAGARYADRLACLFILAALREGGKLGSPECWMERRVIESVSPSSARMHVPILGLLQSFDTRDESHSTNVGAAVVAFFVREGRWLKGHGAGYHMRLSLLNQDLIWRLVDKAGPAEGGSLPCPTQ